MITGGCFCGAIRFEISAGSYTTANCHCTLCRRIHAAPFVSWLVIPAPNFSYTSGRPETLQSSEAGARYFCTACGTHIACINENHPQIIDVTLGSLDDPTLFAPTLEVYEDTRLAWLHEYSS